MNNSYSKYSKAKRLSNRASGLEAASLSASIQNQLMKSLNFSSPISRTSVNRNRRRLANDRAKRKPEEKKAHLTQDEWEEIRKQAQKYNHSSLPCAICQEEFKVDDQILLSCGHVFHKHCVSSFEKFTGSRCCPLCRKTGYAKKLIKDGEIEFRKRCAIKIQSVFRGFKVRKEIKILRAAQPPKEKSKRKAFFLDKLTKTTNDIVEILDKKDSEIDILFAELDESIRVSRAQIDEYEKTKIDISENQWKDIERKANERNQTECPICMAEFEQTNHKVTVLLSCSHYFHGTCLSSFEEFVGKSGIHSGCPLCRTHYQYKVI